MNQWSLYPGQSIKRTHLHEAYGGRRQGGISPSSISLNVLLFTGTSGPKYGYFDGWQDDGCFHYTGEGQEGDQELKQGNRAVAQHRSAGKRLRLFEGTSGAVVYAGEFEVDAQVPFYGSDAIDVNGESRKVLVFRLRPLGNIDMQGLPRSPESWIPPDAAAICQKIDQESRATEFYQTAGTGERTSYRRESQLVEEYISWRQSTGQTSLTRLKIKPPGELLPLYCDLFDASASLIIEAKGTVNRDALRMAVGQLYDYRRFAPDLSQIAVLLPELPRQDLLNFLWACGVSVIFKTSNGSFECTGKGRIK